MVWHDVTVPKLHCRPPFQGLVVHPPPQLHLNPDSLWPIISPFSFTAKVCSEWGSSLVKEQKPWYIFFFLKNTIRTKAMINTRNWNKWQLTAENHLPAVGGRKLLTAGPHWVASKREELAGAGENTHRHSTSLQGCALGQRCPVGSVSYVSFTIKW